MLHSALTNYHLGIQNTQKMLTTVHPLPIMQLFIELARIQ